MRSLATNAAGKPSLMPFGKTRIFGICNFWDILTNAAQTITGHFFSQAIPEDAHALESFCTSFVKGTDS
jgi:hypothetical protein